MTICAFMLFDQMIWKFILMEPFTRIVSKYRIKSNLVCGSLDFFDTHHTTPSLEQNIPCGVPGWSCWWWQRCCLGKVQDGWRTFASLVRAKAVREAASPRTNPCTVGCGGKAAWWTPSFVGTVWVRQGTLVCKFGFKSKLLNSQDQTCSTYISTLVWKPMISWTSTGWFKDT